MEISVSLVKSRFPNFGIRSTISETMDFVAKSRFVSLYEYFANRIRITSLTDVKKIRLTLNWYSICKTEIKFFTILRVFHMIKILSRYKMFVLQKKLSFITLAS